MLREFLQALFGEPGLQKTDNSAIEYELKIDAQVEKFFETKQKLTYFLITASTAVIAFLVNFVASRLDDVLTLVWLVILSVLAGLVSTGSSIRSLHCELLSYRLHLKYRYERKNWAQLSAAEQRDWNSRNAWALRYQNSAFVFLFIEIAFAVMFFILFFLIHRIADANYPGI
jgi:hypothetical protein